MGRECCAFEPAPHVGRIREARIRPDRKRQRHVSQRLTDARHQVLLAVGVRAENVDALVHDRVPEIQRDRSQHAVPASLRPPLMSAMIARSIVNDDVELRTSNTSLNTNGEE
jgi:hypothetical protein